MVLFLKLINKTAWMFHINKQSNPVTTKPVIPNIVPVLIIIEIKSNAIKKCQKFLYSKVSIITPWSSWDPHFTWNYSHFQGWPLSIKSNYTFNSLSLSSKVTHSVINREVNLNTKPIFIPFIGTITFDNIKLKIVFVNIFPTNGLRSIDLEEKE